MVNYKDEDQNALELLGLAPEDCHGMLYAKISEDYIVINFKLRNNDFFSYVDKFRKLQCNPYYDVCSEFQGPDKDVVEYLFFFNNPEEMNFFDMSPMPLTEGEGQYV